MATTPPASAAIRTHRAASALVAVALGLAACADFEGETPKAETDIASGAAARLVSDGSLAYLVTNGLFSFLGQIHALDASGEVVWTSTWAGGVSDLMIGPDDVIYVSSGGALSTMDREGRRGAFDAESLGSLAWHPWGVPMSYGDGILVVDRFGNTLARGLEEETVHRAVSAPDGSVFALVTTTGDGVVPEGDHLYKLNARLELQWYVAIDEISSRHGLALHEDFLVVSSDSLTEARTWDGEWIWGVTPAFGEVLIHPDGTTYISGARRVAVAPDGEIIWDIDEPSRMTLTTEGLGAMVVVTPEYQRPTASLVSVNRQTGERSGSAIWEITTDFVAPVVVGGRLLGAAHRIATSQGTVPGGDISVSQSADTSIRFGGSAGHRTTGWPTSRGPGGARALPFLDVTPTERDLYGLWAASRDGSARAIRFASEAPAFGLFAEPVYGLWDYATSEMPRLVQVGRWSFDGSTVTLVPAETLAGVDVRTSLRVQAAPPGVLSIDDPLQDVVRPFSRASGLPGSTALPAKAALAWIDDSGAGRGEFGDVRVLVADDDGTRWAVSEYDGTGYFGERQFRPENLTVRNGEVVAGNMTNEIVARIGADGEFTNYFHNEALGGSNIRAIIPDGDSALLIGPLATGAFERTELMSLRLTPGPDESLIPSDEVAWFGADDEGDVLAHHVTHFAGLAEDSDLVFFGERMSADDADRGVLRGRSTVLRATAGGAIEWETRFDAFGADVHVQDATVNVGDGAIYVVGTTTGEIAVAGEAIDAWDVPRGFVARLDIASGEVEAVEGLGAGWTGALWNYKYGMIAPHPDGGFVYVHVPAGALPYNAGTGGQPDYTDGNAALVISFDANLRSRWTTRLTNRGMNGSLFMEDVHVDAQGVTTVVGGTRGLFKVEGQLNGRADTWSPVLQFSPCGQLLQPRRFVSRVWTRTVSAGPNGSLLVGGDVMSDIIEPPFIIPWNGVLPTPSSPIGNRNNFMMEFVPEFEPMPSVEACSEPEPSRSQFSVRIDGTGTGRVVSEPPGIDCPGTCAAEFDDLAEVRLVATPAAGHTFAGYRAEGASPLRCDGLEDCGALVTGDVEVHAYFDAASLEAAVALPLDRIGGRIPLVAAGDRAVLAATLSGPVETTGGSYDPATDGGADVLIHLDASGPTAVSPIGRASTHALGITVDGTVAMVSNMLAIAPLLDAPSSERTGIAVFEPGGAVRWARALPNSGTANTHAVALSEEFVGVVWITPDAFEMDGVAVDAGYSAFAIFDVDTGDVVTALSLGDSRAAEVLPNHLGGFTVSRVYYGQGVTLDPPDGFDYADGAQGPAFWVFDSAGALVDATRWQVLNGYDVSIDVPGGADPNTPPGGDLVRLDDAVRATFRVATPAPAALSPFGAVLADLPVDVENLPVADPEATRLSLVAWGWDAAPRAVWSTRAEDEVSLRAVATGDDVTFAVGAATRLRDAEGEIAVEDAEFVFFTVKFDAARVDGATP
jgi:hypothetical protein